MKNQKIMSLKNDKIQQLVLLHERKNRFLQQMFLVEGQHLITMALLQKRLITVFIDEDFIHKYHLLLAKCVNQEIIITNATVINKLSQNKNPQPLIGVCNIIKPATTLVTKNIVLIDNIQDPGNLGNILRSVSAFNISEVYLSLTSVDLYNHKVISASQGAIFFINVYYENFDDLLIRVKKNSYTIYGTFLHEKNSTCLPWEQFSTKNAFLFGNEGSGINEKYKLQINKNIIIPTTTKVESLNLATSVAIVIYCLFAKNILK